MRVIDKFRLDEISAVDRPAQEGAKMTIMKRADSGAGEALWLLTKGCEPGEIAKLSAEQLGELKAITKRDFSDKERERLASSGAALPDGSYPIENEGDLENAIRAIGRAKDPAKAKAHIISRAKSLGATDKLPEGWAVSKADDNKGTVMNKELLKALGLAETASEAEVTAAIAKLAKSTADLEKANKLLKAKADMTDDEKAYCKDLSDGDADDFAAMSHEDRGKKMKKAAEGDETFTAADGTTISKRAVGDGAFAVFKSQDAALKKAQADIAKANEEAAKAKFEKRAQEELPMLAGTIEKKASLLKAVETMPEADRTFLTDVLKGAEAMVKAGFAKLGAKGGGEDDDTSADAQLDKLAKAHAEKHNVSYAVAYDAVSRTPEGQALYKRFTDDRRANNGAAH